MGYGGTPDVRSGVRAPAVLVFLLVVARCFLGIAFTLPSCWRSALIWKTRSARLMGGVGFGLLSLVYGFGFYLQDEVLCLFSSHAWRFTRMFPSRH